MSEFELGQVLTLFDKQIHEQGLERLKLILYPLVHWRELKLLKTPSEIYLKLASLERYSAEGKAMEMFLFCLRAIGGRVRGKYCATEARKMLQNNSVLDFSAESKKFRFFFWLLKIVRRIPAECKEVILHHFGRSLNVNHRYYEESLSNLFIELHQGQKVHENDTKELEDVLKICKNRFECGTDNFAAVEKCILYIDNFNKDEEGEPFSSGNAKKKQPIPQFYKALILFYYS